MVPLVTSMNTELPISTCLAGMSNREFAAASDSLATAEPALVSCPPMLLRGAPAFSLETENLGGDEAVKGS